MKLESWRLTDTEIQERFSRGLDVISRAREGINNINPNQGLRRSGSFTSSLRR